MSGNQPGFEFEVAAGATVGSQLIVGTAAPGVVGLTAVDYLVTHAEATQVGHVATRGLADVVPFTDGTPRHPSRLYTIAESDVSILLSEVFLPVGVAEPFADALFGFAESAGVEEFTLVYGVPYPHGPDEHDVFHVATESYRARHVPAGEIPALKGGYFDGYVGEVMLRGLGTDAPRVGALVTPAHPPGPDFDAALLVLEAVADLYDLAVDEADLRRRAEALDRQYRELAERIQTLDAGSSPSGSDYPEDRMFN